MAIVEQIKCDGCGIIKGEANHWYIVFLHNAHGESWKIFPWQTFDRKHDVKHLCGQQCAHKLLDEFFQDLANLPLTQKQS